MRFEQHTNIAALLMICLLLTACSKDEGVRPAPTVPTGKTPQREQAQRPEVKPLPDPQASAIDGASTLAKVMERGELRVGMQIGYVPFEMAGADGTPSGLDVDIAGMVAESLGVGLRLVKQNWQALIPSLLEGKNDLIISGMTITPQRNAKVVFTDPILETGRMFLVHKNDVSRFKRFRDLDAEGVFLVAGRGGLGDLRLKDLLPKVGFREFPDSRQALEEVLQGRAHAYVDEEFAVRMACARNSDKLLGRFDPLTYEPIAWAIRPGDLHWLNWLNNFIRSIKKDGRLEKLKTKWLQDYFLDLQKL